ncbi:hypothetical protein PS914_03877 [Pseudomonas fluorescens]|uniref:hypothetical protein n=1 Tax=Pseudomonas fluorescens TaxID=294 RepID=UPI00123F12AC|nr:hypothetical protein [Pseudomonas fluorescens]VVP99012.1 hypothetical protein PS914_03877 [Pseudomonas fluorescens]
MGDTNSNLTQADIPGGAYPTTAGAAKTISYLLFEQQQFQGKENAVARLYNNQRQVSEFLITLEARDEHGQIAVVPDETLIEIIPFSNLQGRWPAATGPHVRGYLPFDESVIFDEADSAESFASSCSAEAVSPDKFLPLTKPELHTIQSSDALLIQRKTFKRYLTNDENPGTMQDRFAVRVRLPGSSTTYASNNEDVPYGGSGQNGRFYSSVYLRSVAQPHYTVGNGGLVENVEEIRYHDAYWYAYNHYIGFNLPGTVRPVAIKHTEPSIVTTTFRVYDFRRSSGKAYYSILVGIRTPENPNHLGYWHPSNWNDDAGRWLTTNGYVKPSSDRLVFVVSGLVPTENTLTGRGQTSLMVFDVYGNSRAILIGVDLINPESNNPTYRLRLDEVPVLAPPKPYWNVNCKFL